MPDHWPIAVCVVFLAFTVESTLGFGATVITVALGAQFISLRLLLSAFIPVNLLLLAYLGLRYFRHIDGRLLLRRFIPLMLLGMPLGMLAERWLDESLLLRVFGLFVCILAALELRQMLRSRNAPIHQSRQLRMTTVSSLLLLGGAVHGAFGTGGPMAIYAAGRTITEKTRFRATMGMLWLVLNSALVAGFVQDGRIGLHSAKLSATFVPALGLGMLIGERIHHRVSERGFRLGVYAMLLCAGIVLLLRN